jgi:murein DD-endopeptidase MepM/ murein hydrolase activator NlpD
MPKRGLTGTERCIWLMLLFITGDVRPRTPHPESTAEAVVAMVDAGDLSGLPDRLSVAASHELSMERLQAQATKMRDTYGAPQRIYAIVELSEGGTFGVVAERGEWQLSLMLTDEGKIDELSLEPKVARSALLGLPVTGEWSVSNGGRTRRQNRHIRVPNQRRAADLSIVDASSKKHRGDGTRNEDYFAYGRDIVAMADGEVVIVVDGVHENATPGKRSHEFGPGNMVLLEHPDGLHTLYAHLIPGSIAVEVGDRVRRGQLLGHCGNSGRSSAPHLHVHGQDGPLWNALGVELVFEKVWKRRGTGKPKLVHEYEFNQRDIISSG